MENLEGLNSKYFKTLVKKVAKKINAAEILKNEDSDYQEYYLLDSDGEFIMSMSELGDITLSIDNDYELEVVFNKFGFTIQKKVYVMDYATNAWQYR